MDTRSLGRFGERQAAAYLCRKGYRIIEMNFSCRAGEIDVIAENEKYLVFVEVKAPQKHRLRRGKGICDRGKAAPHHKNGAAVAIYTRDRKAAAF